MTTAARCHGRTANVVIKPEIISEAVASPIGAGRLNDHIMEGAASVEGGRKKRRRKGRLAIRLVTPELFSEVAVGVTCNGYGDCVSLLREPDAANPHVRFDERRVETEAWRD